jgi:hypothetical protein
MSNEVFCQDLNEKDAVRPGGPFMIQLLFQEPPIVPTKETMLKIMEKHVGPVEMFGNDETVRGFAALSHDAEFKDGKFHPQLMVMNCQEFQGTGFVDAFKLSQMWDCQEDRDRIFSECKYHILGVDMVSATLPAQERANLLMDFTDALAELFPTCEAFYFQNAGKLFLAKDVREHTVEGIDRFIRFGVGWGAKSGLVKPVR